MLKNTLASVLLMLFSFSCWAEKNLNRVHIEVPLSVAYDYITQPDKWHEWFILSKAAKTPGGSLIEGEVFSETVRFNQTDTVFNYRVLEAYAPIRWRVEYSSSFVVGRIDYQLQESIDGTVLIRTLEYYPKPASAEAQKALAEQALQVQATSVRSLRKLKENLEAAWELR